MTPLICWDSDILIHWISYDGTGYSDEMQPIKSVVDYVKNNSCKLAVSTLVYAEVLEGKMTKEEMERFRNFMRNKTMIQSRVVDIPVAEKAGEIRSRSNIKTPDAIHIATAIVIGAESFHTFDDRLLRLNGKEEVNGLSITACEIV